MSLFGCIKIFSVGDYTVLVTGDEQEHQARRGVVYTKTGLVTIEWEQQKVRFHLVTRYLHDLFGTKAPLQYFEL